MIWPDAVMYAGRFVIQIIRGPQAQKACVARTPASHDVVYALVSTVASLALGLWLMALVVLRQVFAAPVSAVSTHVAILPPRVSALVDFTHKAMVSALRMP